MLNGIYSTSFVGNVAAGTGVVIIDGGRIMGGDTSFVYRHIKEEQFLIEHVLKLVDAVNLRPSEEQGLLRRVSLAID